MKIERFNVGWLSSPASIWRQDEELDSQVRFPIPAYLIETDRERILIDTGLSAEAARDPQAYYMRREAGLFQLELESDIGAQVDLRTITRVIITHLHFDHAGSLALLPRSTPIIVQRREWEGGRDEATIHRNFFYPRDYAMLGDNNLVLVEGDHDLLGDGSIRLLLTPGHTPGHQSVMLEERLVLAADVVHFMTTLDDERFPAFADDFSAQARSVARLRHLRGAGMTIVPGHDPDILQPGQVAL